MARILPIFAAAGGLVAAVSVAQVPQTQTIVEVDHVGNRITVSAPGMDDRIVDLDDAAISGADARRLTVGDLHAGDQVLVDGTLRGPRFDATSVRIVPAADPTLRRPPGSAREPNAFQPGEPVPPGTSRDPSALRPGDPTPPGSTRPPNAMQPGDPIPPARSGAGAR